jgi:crossover junction endodeoxyribonuclease RuvC
MIILGIDPGCKVTGFSVIKREQGKTFLVDYGTLLLSSSQSLVERVGIFHDFFDHKIVALHITDIALEIPFLGKNAQNFLKLGYLRGIVYLLVSRYRLGLHEFSPREVKLSVTGFGGADKVQVARVIVRLFPIAMPDKLDVTDALAVALCGLWKAR